MLLADVALRRTEGAAVRACSLLTLSCVVQAWLYLRWLYWGYTYWGYTYWGYTYGGYTY